MNVVLLVVDSLRSQSLRNPHDGPKTQLLDRLDRELVSFTHAYAAECWTLPSHCSMFTGLLPSEHRAHFQTMAYEGTQPTLAELLAARGFYTELITRNFVFDGSIPGITRGFCRSTHLASRLGHPTLYALFLALAKPRFRRHVRETGFFHPFHRDSRSFLSSFARALLPADELSLEYLANAMKEYRARGVPYFFFCNLYDVHAPYPPAAHSLVRPLTTWKGLTESLTMHAPLAKIGAHAYLREGFRMSGRARRLLLGRYHDAIELMDAKLNAFVDSIRSANLLDDTLLVVTSDHGEAFGEHELYLHDASVYNTHLHVPLWIHHPAIAPKQIDDVVSTRSLFNLVLAATAGRDLSGTILDDDYRSSHGVALAEHFYYPHVRDAQFRYKQNLRAVAVAQSKFIRRSGELICYMLEHDPGEQEPHSVHLEDLRDVCRVRGLPPDVIGQVVAHLQ